MAAAAPEKEKQQDAIPLSSLPLQELNTIKQQTEQELEQLMASLELLGGAVQRFSMGKEALEDLLPPRGAPGKQLYVPATVDNVESVLVDVGAKYYIRKSLKGAIDYNSRRVATIRGQMEKIEAAAQNKQRLLEGVVATMNVKIRQQQAAQAAAH